MATCGSLHPLPESLLWTNISITPLDPPPSSSFTELFRQLHFKENPQTQSTMSPSSPLDFGFSPNPMSNKEKDDKNGSWSNITDESSKGMSIAASFPYACHKKSDSFSSMNFESLQLCTEGLGFESCADVEDLKNDEDSYEKNEKRIGSTVTKQYSPRGSSYQRIKVFPPPISSIGRSGKPGVCFKSYREDGRFVLKEVRIQRREFLHACREDGRLKLHFIQPSDEMVEDEDEEGDEDCDAEQPEDKMDDGDD